MFPKPFRQELHKKKNVLVVSKNLSTSVLGQSNRQKPRVTISFWFKDDDFLSTRVWRSLYLTSLTFSWQARLAISSYRKTVELETEGYFMQILSWTVEPRGEHTQSISRISSLRLSRFQWLATNPNLLYVRKNWTSPFFHNSGSMVG